MATGALGRNGQRVINHATQDEICDGVSVTTPPHFTAVMYVQETVLVRCNATINLAQVLFLLYQLLLQDIAKLLL